MDKKILDACCGSRMWHFGKSNKEVLFMDNRELNTTLCDGRKLIVSPASGCGCGGLNWQDVKEIMEDYLSDINSDIRIYVP